MGETLYIKDYYDAFHIEKMMAYKRIDWRKSPILRGTRYRMLMKSRQGRDTFLVFSAIADLVVKHKSLGKLVDSDGFPITPEVIEIDTGIPLQVCEEAYVALCDPKIGWLTTDASKIGLPSTHQDKPKTFSRHSQDKQDVLESSLDKSREDKSKSKPPLSPTGGGVRVSWQDGVWSGISDKQRTEWTSAYPSVNIDGELAKATAWLRSNPDRAGKRNWARFLNSWFARAHERSPVRPAWSGSTGRIGDGSFGDTPITIRRLDAGSTSASGTGEGGEIGEGGEGPLGIPPD